MAYDNSRGNGTQQKPVFRLMYNPERGGSFAKVEGLGLVQISGYFSSVESNTWPVTPLKGDYVGKESNVEEALLQRVSRDELAECFALTGQKAPEPRPYVGNQGGNRNQGNHGDRPRSNYLFMDSKPYGATVKVEESADGRLLVRISRTDAVSSASALPPVSFRQVDARVKAATDKDRREIPGQQYSYVLFELAIGDEATQVAQTPGDESRVK
ncbi:MAG: hypothetical protein HY226_03400 [Candidatus Vogelbacteria bacterium]|nr:hypothetical protein [Candidatus Vogelbacteria bacterium]